MVMTMRDHILKEGREQGQREILKAQMEERFGPLSEAVAQRLQSWRHDQLLQLSLALLEAQSLKELGLED